jgi:hypothetical protein
MKDIQRATRQLYDLIGEYREGRAIVWLNDKYGVVDLEGNEVVPLLYECIGNFSEGRASVELNGKTGIIDLDGNEVIPCWYTVVRRHSYGFITMHWVSDRAIEHLYFDRDGHLIAKPVIN